MGNCCTREKITDEVSQPLRMDSVRLCDDNLAEGDLEIPEINYDNFNRIALDWETIGQLIPCDLSTAEQASHASSTDGERSSLHVLRQVASRIKRGSRTKSQDTTSSALRSIDSGAHHSEPEAINKFKEAMSMWSNFKISEQAAKKLHGITDAFNYCDKDHVPLPQSIFRSREGSSLDELLSRSANSSRGPDTQRTYQSSKRSGAVGSESSAMATDRTRDPLRIRGSSQSFESGRKEEDNIDAGQQLDWLNYELVLRPYLNEEKSQHKYACVVRPRCEDPLNEKRYNIDEALVQTLGDILDPFQLQKNNENKTRLMEIIKRTLYSPNVEETEGSSQELPAENQLPPRTVHRIVKSGSRRAEHLRYLSTISDSSAGYSNGGHKYRTNFSAAAALGLDDAICYNLEPMDPNKPCQPKFRRRPKRESRFGDMSDIPLLV